MCGFGNLLFKATTAVNVVALETRLLVIWLGSWKFCFVTCSDLSLNHKGRIGISVFAIQYTAVLDK